MRLALLADLVGLVRCHADVLERKFAVFHLIVVVITQLGVGIAGLVVHGYFQLLRRIFRSHQTELVLRRTVFAVQLTIGAVDTLESLLRSLSEVGVLLVGHILGTLDAEVVGAEGVGKQTIGVVTAEVEIGIVDTDEAVGSDIVAIVLHGDITEGKGVAETQIIVATTLGDKEGVEARFGHHVAIIGIDGGEAVTGIDELAYAVAVVHNGKVRRRLREHLGLETVDIVEIFLVVDFVLNGSKQIVGTALLALEHHIASVFGSINDDELIVASDARTGFVVFGSRHILRIGESVEDFVVGIEGKHRTVVGDNLPCRSGLLVVSEGEGVLHRSRHGTVVTELHEEQVTASEGSLVFKGRVKLDGPSVLVCHQALGVELAGTVKAFCCTLVEEHVLLVGAGREKHAYTNER